MAKKKAVRKNASGDIIDESGTNYVMGEIVVDDGSARNTAVLDEYAEEVDDDAESQAKSARKKLMNESNSDDALAGNPNDTDDFSKLERYDSDEDWPLE